MILKVCLRQIKDLPSHKIHFVFATSANMMNPVRNKKLMRAQYISEFVGHNKVKGTKQKDSTKPFYNLREKIIEDLNIELTNEEVYKLTKKTRGLRKDDIVKVVMSYKSEGVLPDEINHKTNTCDPMTGNWTEHLMNPKDLQKVLLNDGISSKVVPGYYCFGNENIISASAKSALNFIIKFVGSAGIYFAHYWMITSQDN